MTTATAPASTQRRSCPGRRSPGNAGARRRPPSARGRPTAAGGAARRRPLHRPGRVLQRAAADHLAGAEPRLHVRARGRTCARGVRPPGDAQQRRRPLHGHRDPDGRRAAGEPADSRLRLRLRVHRRVDGAVLDPLARPAARLRTRPPGRRVPSRHPLHVHAGGRLRRSPGRPQRPGPPLGRHHRCRPAAGDEHAGRSKHGRGRRHPPGGVVLRARWTHHRRPGRSP